MPRDISRDQPFAGMLKAIEEQLEVLLDNGPPDLDVLCLVQKLQLWAYEIKDRIDNKNNKSRVRSRPSVIPEHPSQHRPSKRQREAADLLRSLANSAPRQCPSERASKLPRHETSSSRRPKSRAWTKIRPRRTAKEARKPAVVQKEHPVQSSSSTPVPRVTSTTGTVSPSGEFTHPTSDSPKFFYMNVPSALKSSAVLPRTCGLAKFFDHLRKTRDNEIGAKGKPAKQQQQHLMLTCRVCSKEFSSAPALREHMVEHVSLMSESRRKAGGYRAAWKQSWFLETRDAHKVTECSTS